MNKRESVSMFCVPLSRTSEIVCDVLIFYIYFCSGKKRCKIIFNRKQKKEVF